MLKKKHKTVQERKEDNLKVITIKKKMNCLNST